MRAAAFTEFGSPEHVTIEMFDDPHPAPEEVLLDIEACSLNHHDLWILRGDLWVGREQLPYVAGMDIAGTVSRVGDGVERFERGERVLLCPNLTCGSCRFCREGPENYCEQFDLYHGGLAEYATVQADRLISLPSTIEPTQAAALPVSYMTAFRMLKEAEIGPGDLVFVPGATGGVGVATIQLASVLGAQTIGTSTSGEKLDRLERLDADYVIKSGDLDEIREAVLEIGRVDATINHLGGSFSEVGLNVLRRGGRMVVCGQTAGSTSTLSVDDLFLNHKRVIGSTMGTQPDLKRLVGLVDHGQLDPSVHETYPLEDTGRAFADMANRDVVGKLIVEP